MNEIIASSPASTSDLDRPAALAGNYWKYGVYGNSDMYRGTLIPNEASRPFVLQKWSPYRILSMLEMYVLFDPVLLHHKER